MKATRSANILSKLKNNQLFRLEGKSAIVTGAAQGIGLAIARGFAYSGAKVGICDINIEEATKQSELLNEELNGRYTIPIEADVTEESDIEKMIDLTVKEFGSLNVACNNAGMVISSEDNYSLTVTSDDYDKQMELNVRAVFRCCQKEADYMIRNKIANGKIINTASISGFMVNWPQRQTVYNMTKGAVLQMTRCLAVEWAPYGIQVNCISPGFTLTPLIEGSGLEELKKLIAKNTPLQRMSDPEEQIGGAIYLASDASSFTTGIQVVQSGGFELW